MCNVNSCIAQVQHSRSGNCQWKVQQAGFGQKRQKLSLESTTNLSTEESLSMDYGHDKTDTQILLDYGTMDTDTPQVNSVDLHPAGATAA